MAGFDIQGAKAAGYTPGEIAEFLAAESKFDLAAAREAGYDDDEIVQFLSDTTPAPAAPSIGNRFIGTAGSGAFITFGNDPGEFEPQTDEQATIAPQVAPVIGSVMGGYQAPQKPLIQARGAPVTPEKFEEVRAAWENATPEQRAKIESSTDWRGGVARSIAASYAGQAEAPTLDSVDPRLEKRIDQRISQGAEPNTARNMALTNAAGGSVTETPDNLADILARRAAEASGSDTAGEIVRGAVDLAGSVAKVAPTTGKMALDVAQMVPLIGIAAEMGSDALADIIDDISKMQSGQMQGKAARLSETIRNGNPAQIAQLLLANPDLLSDVAIPSAGSMFLIGGAGSLIGKAQAARYADKLSPRALARVQQRAATEGAIWTNAAVNAGAAFDGTDGPTTTKYVAALIAGAGTRAAGKITQGGAEGAIARGATSSGSRLGAALQIAGREMPQEFLEGASEGLGTQTGEVLAGTRDGFTPMAILNQGTVEAFAAGPMGAAVGAATYKPRVPSDPLEAAFQRGAELGQELMNAGAGAPAGPVPSPLQIDAVPIDQAALLDDVIRQNNGQPFPSEQAARNAAKVRRISAVPVQVGNGWGLQRVAGLPIDQTPADMPIRGMAPAAPIEQASAPIEPTMAPIEQTEAQPSTAPLDQAPAGQTTIDQAPTDQAAPRPFDHGELNIPGRTSTIDAELDRYNAEQARARKATQKTEAQQRKVDKAEAKRLHTELGKAIVARYGDKFGRKELEQELDQMAKWEPKKFIDLANKFQAEQAAAVQPDQTTIDDETSARVRTQQSTDAKLRLESQWQWLMTGAQDEVAVELTPEDAREHLARLDAAPGDNAQARAVLNAVLSSAAPAPTTAPATTAVQPDVDILTTTPRKGLAVIARNRALKAEPGAQIEIEQRGTDWVVVRRSSAPAAQAEPIVATPTETQTEADLIATSATVAPAAVQPEVEAAHIDSTNGDIERVTAATIDEAADESTLTNARKWLQARVKAAKKKTADPELVEEYGRLLAEAADARRISSLKKTKYEQVRALGKRADHIENNLLPGLRKRIGYVTFKVPGDGTFRVLNTPQNLDAFAQKVGKAPGFASLKIRPQDRATPADMDTTPDQVENQQEQQENTDVDPYATIETRPGTTDAQRASGRDAIESLVATISARAARSGGGSATVLGNALYDGFSEAGGVSLVGQTVKSAHDLATLAQVFRDPRFETVRVFYTDASGKIVGEAGYSSRLPAAVFLPTDIEQQIDRDRRGFGATNYWVLHNHPSGRAMPSIADLDMTRSIAATAAGFAGHIVIDRNEYATIDARGNAQTTAAPELAGVDFNSQPRLQHHLLGETINSPDKLATIAKALQIEGAHATLVFTRRSGEVQLLVDIPAAMLQDSSKLGIAKVQAFVRRAARATGAGGHRFAVLPNGERAQAFEHLINSGAFIDVIGSDGKSLNESGAFFPGDFMDRVTKSAAKVGEADPAYNDETDAEPDRDPPPAETRFRKAQRIWQDKFNRFRVIQDWLTEQGVALSEQADVFRAEERMHGRAATRIEDFREVRIKPLIAEIRKAGLKLADIADFLHAQHAQERNEQIAKINSNMPDGGSGMTTAEAAAKLAQYRQNPELVRLANELRAVTDDTREMLLDAGIISQEMNDAWSATYQAYVPLRGGPDNDASQQGTGKGLTAKQQNKRALGHGQREAGEWIIENILQAHERAILTVEKNRVGQHLLKLALEAGHPDLITIGQPVKRQILRDKRSYVVNYRGAAVESFQALADAQRWVGQEATKAGRKPGDFTIAASHDMDVVLAPSPVLDPTETQVYVKGHAIRVQFKDELLGRAWNNLGAEHMNVVFRMAREVNTWMAKAYTGYNPEFLSVNVMRDFITGIANITGEEGAGFASKAVANYPKAFAQLLRYAFTGNASNWIAQYRADGGTTGAAYLSDLERIGTDAEAAYLNYAGVLEAYQSGGSRKAARVAGRAALQAMVGWIENLNKAGENAMRLAVYRTAVETGKSRAQAASLAKNSTVNFNRRGEMGSTMSALYLFFNPAVQGTAALAHSLFMGRKKHQAQAIVAGMTTLGYMVAASMGGGPEDEWEKLSGFAKERYLHLWTGDGWAKIPIPYGYGFFLTLGSQAHALEKGEDPAKVSLKLAASFVEEFSVWGPAANEEGDEKNVLFLLPTIPQIVTAPIVNRTGLGGPIYPESPFDASRPDNLKMWRATQGTVYADVARGLNSITGGSAIEKGWMDISPETLKYLWSTATGGAGNFFVDSAALVRNTTVEGLEPGDLETREIPIVRKFYQQAGDIKGARSRFWTAAGEAREAMELFNRAKKVEDITERRDLAQTIAYEKREILALAKAADKYSRAVSIKRDIVQATMADETKSLAWRRAATKAIEREEAALYDQYVALFKEHNELRKQRTGAAR